MATSYETNPRESSRLTANAKRVLAARYLKRGSDGQPAESPEALFDRVARVVSEVESTYGTRPAAIEDLHEQFLEMMIRGVFLPNSPTLMNAGRQNGMLSACFVIPVDDSIESIFSAVHQAALVQKTGGGTGFSFSRLRPRGDRIASSGGTTSGPISFMRVFAEATNAIQQGAFRRGANMGILRIDHPDIIEFINCKRDLSEFTNFNLSVAVTNDFMETVLSNPGSDHIVINQRTGEGCKVPKRDGHWTVGDVFDLVVLRAWETGEPGIVFIDTMNAANPTPHVGPFESTNACGEQPLLPYESCNLGSINLVRFLRESDDKWLIDWDTLKKCVRLATRFLDNVIDAARFPLPELDSAAKGNRKIGLGVMGFADMLFALHIPYDSDEAIRLGGHIMRVVSQESHQASAELAGVRGTFPNWEGSTWAGRGIRMRNACTTCVAPTGSISLIAGCSGGIEPVFSLSFSRKVLEGTELQEVNPVFENVARREGFACSQILQRVATTGSIQSTQEIPERWHRIFVTAHDITPEWHVRMQAAFQEHCDASISKTINLKNTATKEDVRGAFVLAHRLGCKGVTVYRDGCRRDQPMSVRKREDAARVVEPMDLPPIMPAVRVKQVTPFGNMHVKIVVDPDGECEREVFAQLGKGGDLANADLEAICRLTSLYLRVHGSIDHVADQLESIGSSLSIPTREGRIASLADGLAHSIRKYQAAKAEIGLEGLLLGKAPENADPGVLKKNHATVGATRFKIKCPQPECPGYLTFEEGCVSCRSCGYSQC